MEIRLAPRVNIKTSGKTEIDEKLKNDAMEWKTRCCWLDIGAFFRANYRNEFSNSVTIVSPTSDSVLDFNNWFACSRIFCLEAGKKKEAIMDYSGSAI